MGRLSALCMSDYLSRSLASVNRNKINGILAEIDFRNQVAALQFQNRVSAGGWIVRDTGSGQFAHATVALFPAILQPLQDTRDLPMPVPPLGLHTICATFRQIGVRSYYCSPVIQTDDQPESISWMAMELGVPYDTTYQPLGTVLSAFRRRPNPYKYLRYSNDASTIPASALAEEFFKESLRIAACTDHLLEVSDVDGIFWGQQYTYPIEIKEKTAAVDNRLGEYFGIDVGPFVKLAYYAAKKGNLHSLFVVREIKNVESRALKAWWCITFETLAMFASWTPIAGGRNMAGGSSSVVKIPKHEFKEMTAATLAGL